MTINRAINPLLNPIARSFWAATSLIPFYALKPTVAIRNPVVPTIPALVDMPLLGKFSETVEKGTYFMFLFQYVRSFQNTDGFVTMLRSKTFTDRFLSELKTASKAFTERFSHRRQTR